MTEAEAETLIRSLESAHGGIEAFLGLSADDRATIMSMLEQRAGAEADGTTKRVSVQPSS